MHYAKIRQKIRTSKRFGEKKETITKSKYQRSPFTIADKRASVIKKMAASYSPALHCSTIGAGGLNFSVRNGKRWDPAAITT